MREIRSYPRVTFPFFHLNFSLEEGGKYSFPLNSPSVSLKTKPVLKHNQSILFYKTIYHTIVQYYA